MQRICIVIPARYASTRFPGKLLKQLGDHSILEHVYNRCLGVPLASKIIIATDDERIAEHCAEKEMDYIMTSVDHTSGTDRIAEAMRTLEGKFDYVINVQGDEPFISSKEITSLINLLIVQDADIATLYHKISINFVHTDPNKVKLVTDSQKRVLYFSRSPIPASRAGDLPFQYKIHLGLYGFKADVLQELTALSNSELEMVEMLEQLRWLEAGYSIHANEVKYKGFGIDTEADYFAAIDMIDQQS